MKESHLTFFAALFGLITALVSLLTAINANRNSVDAKSLSKRNESSINAINTALNTPPSNTSGNDKAYGTPQVKRDQEISSLLEGRKQPNLPMPDGPDHINTFFQEPSSDGLKANSYKEAWVMAYIEKHQGEFTYQGRYIYTFGDRNGKRDAIIHLVKEEGVNNLFDIISPIK